MKSLNEFISESIVSEGALGVIELGMDGMYHPANTRELTILVKHLIKQRGRKADLNDIDTSRVQSMCGLFKNSTFIGDISQWDVSNVDDMSYMFYGSDFDGDISQWDVSNVVNLGHAFEFSKFNGDLSKWNVSKVKYMDYMFYKSNFDGDITQWDIRNVEFMNMMFNSSKFSQNIDKWRPVGCKSKNMDKMFDKCPLEKNLPVWYNTVTHMAWF